MENLSHAELLDEILHDAPDLMKEAIESKGKFGTRAITFQCLAKNYRDDDETYKRAEVAWVHLLYHHRSAGNGPVQTAHQQIAKRINQIAEEQGYVKQGDKTTVKDIFCRENASYEQYWVAHPAKV